MLFNYLGALAFEDPEWGCLSSDGHLVKCMVCEPPYKIIDVGTDRSLYQFHRNCNASLNTENPIELPKVCGRMGMKQIGKKKKK
jgi:hypothetical protein